MTPVNLFPDTIKGLTIAPETLRKLWILTAASEIEISAMGEIEVDDGIVHVTDTLHLMEQTGSYGSTELNMEAYAKVCDRYMQEGKPLDKLRFWFHTHPRMGVHFSYQDDDTIDDLGKNGEPHVSAVFNEKGETTWAVTAQGKIIYSSIKISGPRPSYDEKKLARELIESVVTETYPWRKIWKRNKKHAHGAYDAY